MFVQRSKFLRKSFNFLFCVVAISVRSSVNGEATLSGPYPAAISPDANYRGYGSELANRGYSITPAALAYHSNDPVSSVLSQVRDDDVTLISPLAGAPQPPPSANLVRYIILKEYHVLQDGTMVPGASDTIIGKTDGTPQIQISPLGGYSSSSGSSGGYSVPSGSSGVSGGYSSSDSSGGYSAPSSSGVSGGYSSSASSGGYSAPSSSGVSGGYSSSASTGGYSAPSSSSGASSGYSSPPATSGRYTAVTTSLSDSSSGSQSGYSGSEAGSSGNNNRNRRPSARRPNLDEPMIEITRVELPEDSDELTRNTVSGNSGNTGNSGSSGRNNDDENNSTNGQNNDGNDNNDAGNSSDDDNVDDSDLDDDNDAGGEQDDDDDEDDDDTNDDSPSSNNNRGQSSSGNQQRNNNNRAQQAQSSSSGGSGGSGSNRNSGGGRTGNSNDPNFQVTPAQGVVLGNRNPSSNRPQSQGSNTRGPSSNTVLTDAFMFSEPSAESPSTSTTSSSSSNSNRNSSNRNSSNRNRNNSSRNRNRNNRNRNRNRNNRRRNRNRGNSTTTTTAAPVNSEELAPIVLPTSASPQLQEALQLVAQFAQQQANLLSRTKEQAKNIAGSVFNSLTIPKLGFGYGNSSSPYPQSQSPVAAQDVSITKLREVDPSNSTDDTMTLPPPPIADQPPAASASSPQTTYGAPGAGGYGGGSSAIKLNLHQAKANIHQQLAGLKAGLKAGLITKVQNTVAAVHSKGETGTSTTSPSPVYGVPTSPSPVYGAPTPTPSFQIIKAVKGHFISKGQGVATHFVNKGQKVVGHFANKGTQFVGHFANKGKNVKHHFINKGARLTQKASTLVDAKHMHLQNVIRHIQAIFQHNPALTAW